MNSKIPPRRPLLIAAAQGAVRWFFRFSLIVFVKVRVHNIQNFPEVTPFGGPLLICSNHQSNLDPLIMGVVCPFPINYLAKKSLFKFGPLRWFLTWNDSIPLDRSAGIGGIKETLKRLKKKEAILIFPEGARSRTGQLQPVKQGFCTIARRTRVPILPVAIDGAFEACPPNGFPDFGSVHVVVGQPIDFELYDRWSDEKLAAYVEQKIAALFQEARARAQTV
jgi:1-acyl-sn-glycerol-3-phosphate acyltransferase